MASCAGSSGLHFLIFVCLLQTFSYCELRTQEERGFYEDSPDSDEETPSARFNRKKKEHMIRRKNTKAEMQWELKSK